MQISPAGTAKLPFKSNQAGFTLVEVMMSMLIIGLMTGLVVLNLPKDEDPLLEQGRLLATRLQIAAHASMIENHAMGIRFTQDGYQAVRFVGNNWEEIEDFSFDLQSRPVLELIQNGAPIDLKEAEKSEIPVVRYGTTGLATPFELTIDVQGETVRIEGDPDGKVRFIADGNDQ